MTMDLNKHKEAYLNEAKTHLKNMNLALVKLEKSPTDTKLFHQIFRAAHTLKTLSATMNYQHSMALCHGIEDILDGIRHQRIDLHQCCDLLFQSLDHLSATMKNLANNESELDSGSLLNQINSLLNQSHSSDIQPIATTIPPDAIEKIQSIEVKVERLDTLMNLTEELIVNKMKFDALREEIGYPELVPAIESLGRVITDLQYHVMQVRLVPVDFIFNRFVRMTRDLAKQQHKEVELTIEGGDIELDRVLIDQIGESIAHLIRNAIDHGLETPEVRKQKNKPPQGSLWLSAFRSKEAAIIEIRDDGRGLDVPALKKIAAQQRLLPPNASEDDIKQLIFSEISTKKTVTSVSGRGLGLSIAKQNIESTGGSIRVESEPDQGTTFTIEIPLTLAIIKTLFVKVGSEVYAIPIDVVERLLISEEIKGLMNDEAIIFDNKEIPIVRLNELFGIRTSALDKQPIVILKKDSQRLGLAVDMLLSTQEVVIKPLTRAIKENKFFSGAAMIGTGEMVLILDVNYLLRLSKKVTSL